MFKITFPITKTEKLEDGRMIVRGIATSDAIDKQGERLLFDGSVKAMGQWLETGPAVREQHDPLKAVGSGLEMTPLPEEGSIAVRVFVSAAEQGTQTKVREGVLRAFSIGGEPKAWNMVKHGSKTVREITDWEMHELSLVDRPANPACRIDFVKNDRVTDAVGKGEAMSQKADDPKEKPGEKPDETKPPEGEGDAPPNNEPPKEGEGDDAPPPPKEGEGEEPPPPPSDDEKRVKIDKEQEASIVAQVTDAVLAALNKQTEAMKSLTAALVKADARTVAWDLRLALDCLDMLYALRSTEEYEAMNGEPEPPEQLKDLDAAIEGLRRFIPSEAAELLDATISASARKPTLTKRASANVQDPAILEKVNELSQAVASLKAGIVEADAFRKGVATIDEVKKGIEQILKMPVPGRAPMRFIDKSLIDDPSVSPEKEAVLEDLLAKSDVTQRPFIQRELNFLRAKRDANASTK